MGNNDCVCGGTIRYGPIGNVLFSGFSLYFLLANLLVAPLIPVIIYLALLAFVFSPVAELHHCILFMLEEVIKCLNWGTWTISRLPSAFIDSLYLSSLEVCLLYAFLCWDCIIGVPEAGKR